MRSDFTRLTRHLVSGGRVVWPLDGVGTGLADLQRRAPLIWKYLEVRRRLLESEGAHKLSRDP